MKTLTTFTALNKTILPIFAVYCLTGCQTTPTTSTPAQLLTPQTLNSQQSQKLLVSTIKNSLYHNQDWVAEQQLFLQSQANLSTNATDKPSRLKQIEQCQTEHDKALVAQLKADKITTYKAVKKLSDAKKTPYESIKQTYINCYHTAENLPENDENISSDLELPTDSDDYPEKVSMAMKVLGFKSGQVANFNNFFAKSGKLTYTGNYRPYQGKLALQVDAGFENKNLRSHYRLPMVADFKNQTLYLKPDVIMPYTALYLDNKMGMSWQDKWYQFTSDSQQPLPASLSKKTTAKAWLKAVMDSFLALPSEQFSTATPAEISSQVLPNLTQSTQKPSQNLADNQVIHWHQTANQQIALTQTIINRYISTIEQNLANDKTFLALSESEQTRYHKLWEKQKKQLLDYRDSLNKTSKTAADVSKDENSETPEVSMNVKNAVDAEKEATATTEVDSADDSAIQDNITETIDTKNDTGEDDEREEKKSKNPLLASRPQGQDWYFVLGNHQIKHIYIDNGMMVMQQPAKLHTWVTFNPDPSKLATANQPQTLENLAKTLRPEVVIDGRAEMKRLAELDDSRRLFGQEPEVVKYYKDYMKKSKQQAKKASQE